MFKAKERKSVLARDFDEVTGLAPAAQRRLLVIGAPEERVWAAWALGLTLGIGAKPDLLAAFERTDHPGVRRQLIVMLAGFGEQPLLATLAEQEADDAVRATAAQYLLQTSRASDDARLRPVIERLLHDPSPDVRYALLLASQSRQKVLRLEDLVTLAADPDRAVRELAIEILKGRQHAAGV
jgi:HEAT repeat protein